MTYKYSPKVTVLMSVYNGERYLKEAIDSILAQTFTDFEFLIIDDSSIDKTSDILRNYKDFRIKIFTNEKNVGLTKSLNIGLGLARGEYIARIDADDIAYPERLEVQYHYLENHPEVGIVGSWTELIDEFGSTIDFWRCQYCPEDIYYILNFRNCLTHSSVMINRQLLVDAGGYSEDIEKAQDFELWNRLSKITQIHQLPMILVKWRKIDNNIDKRIQQNKTKKCVIRNGLKMILSEEIDDHLVDFFIDNFDTNPQNNRCINDIHKTVSYIKKINSKIIDTAPIGLNKGKIKKISDKYAIDYCVNFSKKMGIFKSMKCLNYLAYSVTAIPHFISRLAIKRVIQ